MMKTHLCEFLICGKLKGEIDFEGLYHSETGNDWLEFSPFFFFFLGCVSLMSVMERFLVPDATALHTWKHVEKWTFMHREMFWLLCCELFWYLMKAVLHYHGNPLKSVKLEGVGAWWFNIWFNSSPLYNFLKKYLNSQCLVTIWKEFINNMFLMKEKVWNWWKSTEKL